jgi:hypothetical protein
MTRREFQIAFGAALGSGILGYFLTHQVGSPQSASVPHSPRPRLRQGLVIEPPGADGMTTIRLSNGGLCAVNAPGAEVLRRLDGAHTIEQIARAAGKSAGVTPDASLTAGMACFVAQLGDAGFLDAPFYAQIVVRRDV